MGPFGAVGELDCSSKDTSEAAAATSGLGTGFSMTAPVNWLIGTCIERKSDFDPGDTS